MKLWDIVRTVGSSVVREVVPGGGLLVEAVNAFLPDDKKLSSDATGSDIDAAVATLPPDQKAAVMQKEFDVKITQIKESNSTLRAMLDADSKSPHTTRPYIAKNSFNIVAFTIVTAVSVWAVGVFTKDSEMVKTVVDGWPFILAVIAPLVTLLYAYFGVLKTEHKNRLDAANGSAIPSGISGVITALLKR